MQPRYLVRHVGRGRTAGFESAPPTALYCFGSEPQLKMTAMLGSARCGSTDSTGWAWLTGWLAVKRNRGVCGFPRSIPDIRTHTSFAAWKISRQAVLQQALQGI
jgi:hypothetical protein